MAARIMDRIDEAAWLNPYASAMRLSGSSTQTTRGRLQGNTGLQNGVMEDLRDSGRQTGTFPWVRQASRMTAYATGPLHPLRTVNKSDSWAYSQLERSDPYVHPTTCRVLRALPVAYQVHHGHPLDHLGPFSFR